MIRQFFALTDRGLRSQIFLWAGVVMHAAMILSLQSSFFNPLFDDSTHRTGKGADFYAVYQAAQNVEDDLSIYERQARHQVVPYFYPHRYHPVVALTIGRLFHLVPPAVAYGIWIILQEILLLVNLILTRRLFSDHRNATIAMGIWLVFSPYFLELYMGQFSFLMSSLVFWMLIALMKEKALFANGSWMLSLCVKSITALFIPVLLKMKRWKTVLLAGLVVAALGLPYFVSVPGSLEAFLDNFTEPPTTPTLAGNQGLTALVGILVLRLTGDWPNSIYDFPARLEAMNADLVFPTGVITVLVVLFTLFMTVRANTRHIPELFFLWSFAYFLFYKHVWEHHYVMMLPGFVLLYYRMRTGAIVLSQKIFWICFSVIALPTLFVFIDKPSGLGDPEWYWSHLESFLFHAPKPLAALALYIILSSALWKARGIDTEGTMKAIGP